jgi:spermidine synthase
VRIYYHRESVAATTTALGIPNDPFSKHLWVNGIGMTNLCTETKIMAHLPLLLHPAPREVLVACFGMGTTVRSARTHPKVAIDVVELVPEVYECFPYFHADGPTVLADPRVRTYVDDGRNFRLMRPKTYDVITIDPAPPVWSAGTVNLYTREFFSLCRDHLGPEGILCLWVPPVGVSEMRLILRTYLSVFPNTHVWRSLFGPQVGLYLTGFKTERPLDTSRFRSAAAEPAIVTDLAEWEPWLGNPANLERLHLADPAQAAQWVEGVPIVTDDHPYTEFPLWRSLFDRAYHTDWVVR